MRSAHSAVPERDIASAVPPEALMAPVDLFLYQREYIPDTGCQVADAIFGDYLLTALSTTED